MSELLKLVRGYPPVLGAMLLVEGVIRLILGGDASVSLGEVVAYLLLPPLAMFLVDKTTGGRRPDGMTIGVGVGGAVVLIAALFLGGGVRILTLPGWLMAIVGLVFLGVAVFVMRLVAPPSNRAPVASLLSESERDEFTQSGDRYGGRHGSFDSPEESDWPPSRRDESPSPAYRAGHSVDDDNAAGQFGASPVSAGPPEPEWPPRRAAESAEPSWSGGAESAWSGGTEPSWSGGPEPAESAWSDNGRAEWSGNAGPAEPDWAQGPADRAWPPSPSVHEWPPRREPEATAPEPDDAPRSWFDGDNATGPSDREWPPADGSYRSSGRRSRHPDQ
jgi:hypothetical protein